MFSHKWSSSKQFSNPKKNEFSSKQLGQRPIFPFCKLVVTQWYSFWAKDMWGLGFLPTCYHRFGFLF